MVHNALIETKECFMYCILTDVRHNVNYYSRSNLWRYWDLVAGQSNHFTHYMRLVSSAAKYLSSKKLQIQLAVEVKQSST